MIAGNQYVYDALGNITEIRRAEGSNNLLYAYAYDSQNQLVREDHYDGNGDQPSNITVSYTYSYDTAGNILSETKTVYSQTGIASTSGKTYAYGNESWQDLLTDVNGSPIIYEGQTYTNGTVGGNVVSGNPIRYTNGTKTYTDLTWEHGRQLTSITTGNKTFTYDYDAEGIRTQKVVDGVVHTYITQNGRVIQESFPYGSSTVIMIFTYDDQGRPFGFWYSTNGGNSYSQYYYAINAQGDVLGIFFTKKNAETNKQETKWMGHYTYDAWGNILSIEDAIGTTPSSPANLMNRNPLRYRGYYYDTETGFYYLQSRYYDPANHRFINSDCYTSTGQGYLGHNMFAYCNNAPVLGIDPWGQWTISFSISANVTLGVGLLVGIGVSFDDDGNIAVQWNYSIPKNQTGSMGIADVGVAGSIHVNRADTVDDLENVASALGASIGSGWYGGFDVTSNTYIADHDAEID